MTDRKNPAAKASTSTSNNPKGHRRRGPDHFASEETAIAFAGLSESESHHEIGDLLQKAGPTLGWPPRLIHHFCLLLDLTRAQDWIPGARPIVWLSVQETANSLGVTPSQVRRNEKKLHELDAIAWKDSPNHRRYGERDENENIVQAWGVDLSPAAALLPLLRETAAEVCSRRAECRRARQRVSALKQSILAAVNTALDAGTLDEASAEAWRRQADEAAGRYNRARLAELQDRLRRLEALDEELKQELTGKPRRPDPDDDDGDNGGGAPTGSGGDLDQADIGSDDSGHKTADRAESAVGPVDNPVENSEDHPDFSSNPGASGRRRAPRDEPPRLPPYDTTKGTVCENITVARSARRKEERGSEARPRNRASGDAAGETVAGVPVPAFLSILPDQIRYRVPARGPIWPDIVDAAGDTAACIGVSKDAWGRACRDLGQEAAAIALTIVAVKHERGIVHSPGGYFRQMTRRHATGDLHLGPSVFGLLPEDWRDRRDGAFGGERRR